MDNVARVGPQLGSWTDSESALRTLSAWSRMFCKRVSSTGDKNASNLTPNRDSLFEFAQTIMAGVPLSENTRLDDLTPLVDWLHLFLHEPGEVIERMNGDQGQSPGQTEIVPFQQHIQRATEGRVFFTTHRGLTGLGPASMESDDTINVLPGGKTHYVLRSANPKDARELRNPGYAGVLPMVLIGDCYLNDGQRSGGSPHGETDRDDPSQDDSQPQGSLPYGLFAPFLREAGLDDFGRKMIVLV